MQGKVCKGLRQWLGFAGFFFQTRFVRDGEGLGFHVSPVIEVTPVCLETVARIHKAANPKQYDSPDKRRPLSLQGEDILICIRQGKTITRRAK